MRNFQRWLLVTFVVTSFGLTACAHNRGSVQFSECVAGKECTLEGTLRLHAGEPAWAAILESDDKCAKLALPDEFYADARQWNGKKVTVSGRAFGQPGDDGSDGTVLFWYTERDRKLAMGMCDQGMGIYVNSMQSRSGRKWPQ